jgi:hypothetical protein
VANCPMGDEGSVRVQPEHEPVCVVTSDNIRLAGRSAVPGVPPCTVAEMAVGICDAALAVSGQGYGVPHVLPLAVRHRPRRHPRLGSLQARTPTPFGWTKRIVNTPDECPPQPIRRLGNASLYEAAHRGCTWTVRPEPLSPNPWSSPWCTSATRPAPRTVSSLRLAR